jgi:hypothetical protein
MSNITLDLDNLTTKQQEKMCSLCELYIIEGKSNTYHFQCEGCYCHQAIEYLQDSMTDFEIVVNNITKEIGL